MEFGKVDDQWPRINHTVSIRPDLFHILLTGGQFSQVPQCFKAHCECIPKVNGRGVFTPRIVFSRVKHHLEGGWVLC